VVATPITRMSGTVAPASAAGPCVSLLVIIVNYRTPELTLDCLRSLSAEIPSVPGTRVIVVDNGSADGSVERIGTVIRDRDWASWASLRPLDRNGGFACGNNRGLETGGNPRHILLLNSDTLVHPGALRHCQKVLDSDPSIGVMSCLVLNSDGTPQNVARRFPTPSRRIVAALGLPWKLPRLFGWADLEDLTWDRWATKRDVDWLGGAFLFIRGDLVRRIGLLDEDFFFYGEDIEFCHRVWQAGYRCHYDPGASITHLGGRSSRSPGPPSEEHVAAVWRARHLVHQKLYGHLSALACLAMDGAVLASRLAALTCAGTSRIPKRQATARELTVLVRPSTYVRARPMSTDARSPSSAERS